MTVTRLHEVWRIVLLAGALIGALASRHATTSDSVSYFDIAHAVAAGSWSSLVNAYWNPLYPLLIAAVLKLARPSRYWEYAAGHAFNVAVFIVSLAGFLFFQRRLIR